MYMVTPPDVSRSTEVVAAMCSVAMSLALSALLLWLLGRGSRLVPGLLILAGAWAIGIGWGGFFRALTVGAWGANMSALALSLAPVLLALQVVTALAAYRVAGRQEMSGHPGEVSLYY
jgi:hypothetical protein